MPEQLQKLARYPFLKEAKDYVAKLNLNLGEIEKHPLYSGAIELGRKRALEGINGEISVSLGDAPSREQALISYVIARILVHDAGNRFLLSKYAASEADLAFGFLQEEDDVVIDEVREDLGIKLRDGRMHFSDYLRLSAELSKKNKRWRLVNRDLDAGWVRIEGNDVLPLLREAVRLRVSEPVSTKGIPASFKELSKQIASLFARKPSQVKANDVREERMPPCVRSMLQDLESGSVSHNERFILATFLLGIGLSLDDVVKTFSRYPAYSEEKTRYQLQFLAGEKGATKYSCPSCIKIKSYGLCKAECEVKHPMNYYFKKSGRRQS